MVIDGSYFKAVNYNKITGNINLGDRVILNTTAVDINLGTGGYHFIIYNKNSHEVKSVNNGHIMKLRYTPNQIKVLAAEEENSPYHEKIKNFRSLDGSIYIVGTLHSMLAPISAMLKFNNPKLNINYIMTDSGALPIHFSKTVGLLKKKNIINNTITIGHAFGGDLECINIYTGIITAKEILNSDITIISMGPGIVGTGTKYGFSGIEQGYIIDAINKLKGTSFAIPRISFSDGRNRHLGISHHTITTLGEIVNSKTNLVLPILNSYKKNIINNQIKENFINDKHNIYYEDGSGIKKAMDHYDLKVSTMGRSYHEDKEYFLSLGAVARYIGKCINNSKVNDCL